MEKRRGHVRNASNWSTTSAVRKRTTTYNEKRDYHSVLQKFGKILYLDFKKFVEILDLDLCKIETDHIIFWKFIFHNFAFSPWLPVWGHSFSGAFLLMVCNFCLENMKYIVLTLLSDSF